MVNTDTLLRLFFAATALLLSSPLCEGFEQQLSQRHYTKARNRHCITESLHKPVSIITATSAKRRQDASPSSYSSSLLQSMDPWDGDDLRWASRIRRRFSRNSIYGANRSTPIRTALVWITSIAYLYQAIRGIEMIRSTYPQYWSQNILSVVSKTLTGGLTGSSPTVQNFAFVGYLAKHQPYRFLTSGFLHGGILHLYFNMDALRKQPEWLETGLGAPLFLTTYLLSIVVGNLNHLICSGTSSVCVGASGGICGLYGLMFISLSKMGNRQAASSVLNGMAILIVGGLLLPRVSNAGHVGGFLAGAVVGLLCGPSYKKSYSMLRKNSVDYDPYPKDYRQRMGFGVMPSKRGLIPIPVLWVLSALAAFFYLPNLL